VEYVPHQHSSTTVLSYCSGSPFPSTRPQTGQTKSHCPGPSTGGRSGPLGLTGGW